LERLYTLYSHINISNILVKEQFGFRTNSSTEVATYILINNILSSVHNKLLVGGLFCDLQREFHCLNHEILLSNMRFYGILDITNKLIKSYLRDGYQRVLLNIENSNKYFSEWEQLKHGVPQGSILGPLFVVIY